MLPLRWFYTLVNAHLCVLKLEASTYIHEQHSIVTSATLAAAARPEGRFMVGKIPSLCTCVHTRAESHKSEHSNILHGLTWRHKFVYVSPVNLSRFRLGQFTTTRDILKQHICTLTRLLILILLLIAGIETNPGPNMLPDKEITQYLKLNESKEDSETLYTILEHFRNDTNINTIKTKYHHTLKYIVQNKIYKDIIEQYLNKVLLTPQTIGNIITNVGQPQQDVTSSARQPQINLTPRARPGR